MTIGVLYYPFFSVGVVSSSMEICFMSCPEVHEIRGQDRVPVHVGSGSLIAAGDVDREIPSYETPPHRHIGPSNE